MRSQRFIRAIGSGYASVAALALLNFLSVPFALQALGREGFGVAATIMQIVAFSQVLQLGVGPSVARFIIDYKGLESSRSLASFLKTAFLIGLVQGVCLLGISLVAVGWLGQLFAIPGQYTAEFHHVAFWCLAASALGLCFNPIQQVLYASQRIDVINYAAIATQTVSTIALVTALLAGYGLVAYAIGAWLGSLFAAALGWWWSKKLGILPSLRGVPLDLAVLPSLTRFSGNVMMISLGLQLVAIAPALVINRTLGAGAMGDWIIGTRLMQFSQQLVGRISNAAEPTLWDIYSSGDRARCRERLVQTSWLASIGATILGAVLLSINGNFVWLWSAGVVAWPIQNDVLVACLLWISAFAATWSMLPGVTKRLGNMRYVPLGESLIVILLLLMPSLVTNLGVVLMGMVVSMLLVRFSYGARRMRADLGISGGSLLLSLVRPLLFWATAVAVALVARSFVSGNDRWAVLILSAALCLAVYVILAYTIALTPAMRQECKNFLRRWLPAHSTKR